MNKKTIIIYSSLAAVVGGIAFLIVNRLIKSRELKDMFNAIESGAGEYGNIDDLTSDNAFNINYWQVAYNAGSPIYNYNNANDKAKLLSKYIKNNSVLDREGNEKSILALINTIPSKADLSRVSQVYQTSYSSNGLLQDIKGIDSTNFILNLFERSDYATQIMNLIKKMPNMRKK
jgi:hypothetical protein